MLPFSRAELDRIEAILLLRGESDAVLYAALNKPSRQKSMTERLASNREAKQNAFDAARAGNVRRVLKWQKRHAAKYRRYHRKLMRILRRTKKLAIKDGIEFHGDSLSHQTPSAP